MSEMINQEKLTMSSFTQVENVVFDKLMATLKDSEFKVFMAIYRKTIGWGKVTDSISTSQLMELTGLSNRVVIQSVKSLKSKSLIEVESGSRNVNKIKLIVKNICGNSTYDEKSQVTKSNKSPMTNSHSTYDEKSHTKENINKLTKEREHALKKSETENSKSQEVYSEEFKPDLEILKAKLFHAGIIGQNQTQVNEKNLGFEIYKFNDKYSHLYESDRQKYTRLISWFSNIKNYGRIGDFFSEPQVSTPVTQSNITHVSPFARLLQGANA